MSLRLIRFVVIMLAALSLAFYALSGPLGVLLQVFTIIALIVLAVLLRRHSVSGAPFTIAAAVMFAIGLFVWWIFVYPVNVELAKWVNGPVPGDWADWRQLWEWGQAANGLAQFAGFAALIASVLVTKVKKDKTAKTWG